MSMDKMKRLLPCVLAVGLALTAHQSFAQELVARTQLRRTADPSPRAAHGSVLMLIDANGNQTFQVDVVGLGQANFAPIVRAEPSFTTNITTVLPLAPLNRTSLAHGDWSRTLVGTNQAPADFLSVFGSLTELDGNSVDISQPGIPLVTTIYTNILANVTNVSFGVTNIVGPVTNVIDGIVIPNPGQIGVFFAALWAPLPALSADPSSLSYHRHGTLTPVGDASPKAKANVNISFSGTSGRSLLEVRAVNLTKGQQYTLFVADRTNQDTYVMIPVDNMVQFNLGSAASLVRDTKFADPLPQQARDIGDLSGRIVQIRDAFDVVHLSGIMP